METLEICGIEVEIERKKIKNLRMYVHPPYGNVTISAPLKMSDETIIRFVTSKIDWIEKHQSKFQKQK
ncbi:YgjP-like metallopeptidase domain-containing protein [Candidatus Methanomassiliicoccus intestinalis]